MQSAKKRKLEKMTLGYKEQQKKKKVQKQQQEDMEEEKFQQNQSDDQEDIQDQHDLKFEDDFDDEFEKEDIVEPGSDQEGSDKWISDDEETDQNNQNSTTHEQPTKQFPTIQEQSEKIKNKQKEKKQKEKEKQKVTPFMGTDKNLGKDEILDFDNRAYEMFHRGTLEWPCLSCDFILPFSTQYSHKNPQFQEMKKYPYEVFLTMGTQSAQKNQNFIYLLKWGNLHKTKYDDDSDNQSDHSQDNDNDEPTFNVQQVQIWDSVNRIRSMNYMPIVAFWTEDRKVTIMDLKNQFNILGGDPMTDPRSVNKNFKTSSKSFSNTDEGFALDWNPLRSGYLASGSCDGKVYIYRPNNQNFSDIIRDDKPYMYHKASVEDICWSPVDENQIASCSVDQTIQINDIRSGNRNQSQLIIKAHDSDVNVISWCRQDPNLIASGADDGSFKVWDIRYPKNPTNEQNFHSEPITSIQFAPQSDSILSVQSADNRLTVWDLAVENDEENNQLQDEEEEIPDQLMFIHQGQTEMKELRYHPIYLDLTASTSGDSIHIFKPNLEEKSSVASKESYNDRVNFIKEKDLDEYLGQMNINK